MPTPGERLTVFGLRQRISPSVDETPVSTGFRSGTPTTTCTDILRILAGHCDHCCDRCHRHDTAVRYACNESLSLVESRCSPGYDCPILRPPAVGLARPLCPTGVYLPKVPTVATSGMDYLLCRPTTGIRNRQIYRDDKRQERLKKDGGCQNVSAKCTETGQFAH
jgi:hypothetical protein